MIENSTNHVRANNAQNSEKTTLRQFALIELAVLRAEVRALQGQKHDEEIEQARIEASSEFSRIHSKLQSKIARFSLA